MLMLTVHFGNICTPFWDFRIWNDYKIQVINNKIKVIVVFETPRIQISQLNIPKLHSNVILQIKPLLNGHSNLLVVPMRVFLVFLSLLSGSYQDVICLHFKKL